VAKARPAVLVVGGAGYIGAHAAKALAAEYEVVVADDLSRGHRWAVQWGDLVEVGLADTDRLATMMTDRRVVGVFHFAASSQVGESVKDPLLYWRNNVAGTASLLTAMQRAGVRRLVFSSTAAVYGEPDVTPITEDLPLAPTNPYGRTKLAVEHMLADCRTAWGLRYAALRYFNAAGADPDGAIGEDHTPESHLLPLILDVALGRRADVTVFGSDYPTPDGTCIRDYVHVTDLATAHVAAFERLQDGAEALTLNLGNGAGSSVRQVIDTVRHVTGRPVVVIEGARRPGDPPRLVASSARARELLGWKPRFGALEDIVGTAWTWHERHFRTAG